MSDARLRELERRWRESGAVDDEATYLLERVRVGLLNPAALAEAARLGHDAAERAGPTERATTLTNFLASQPPPSRQAAQRACVAAARVLTQSDRWDADQVFLDELSALEQWISCPCNAHRDALMEFAYPTVEGEERSDPDADPFGEPEGPLHPWQATYWLSVASLRTSDSAALHDLAVGAREMERHVVPERLLEGVRRDVVPWLLGEHDPLRSQRSTAGRLA